MSDDKQLKRKAKKPIGLGRGLNSLLGDIQQERAIPAPSQGDEATDDAAESESGLRTVAVADCGPNPDQPRQHFDEDALAELASSIKRRGLIQPIVVRPHGSAYQIIAGERRWRAAQKAQIHHIPALVRELDDEETLEVAIVENVQRRDLNAIEEARAYQRLASDYGHSQAQIGTLVGKSRSYVANIMRLTELPDSVQQLVIDGRLEMGHARALINAPNAEALGARIAAEGLTVREAEKLVRQGSESKPRSGSGNAGARGNPYNADIQAVETQLSELLGMTVAIRTGKDSSTGELRIAYRDLDQLDFLCSRLTGEKL